MFCSSNLANYHNVKNEFWNDGGSSQNANLMSSKIVKVAIIDYNSGRILDKETCRVTIMKIGFKGPSSQNKGK
jgi:hypothetical protein